MAGRKCASECLKPARSKSTENPLLGDSTAIAAGDGPLVPCGLFVFMSDQNGREEMTRKSSERPNGWLAGQATGE